MDRILWGVLESCANSSIPRGDQGKGWDCPLSAPVAAWHGRSYQEMKVHLPARSGGLGLSSMVDLIPAAFCGGVQQSLPHFVGQVEFRDDGGGTAVPSSQRLLDQLVTQ